MKPNFHAKAVNGPFEDPCLYVRMLREKRALMFDIGTVSRLSAGSLLKVSDVFITHTHIDHFIGFDSLLRLCLRRPQPLRVYGPENIIDAVEGKLSGYTWNLIQEYPLRLEVFAIGKNALSHASFYAENSFKRLDRGRHPSDGVILKEDAFRVRAVSLWHGIQCIGYALEEEIHINIDKDKLRQRGLPVGPWLSQLKAAIRSGRPDDTVFTVNGRDFSLGQLRDIAIITKGQKLSYITDVSPTEENIAKITELVAGSDALFIEAYFLDADSERAAQRNHLTAKLAGMIARNAQVKTLHLMHFSPKYKDTPEVLTEEAMRQWKG